jgi:hypothetical protein
MATEAGIYAVKPITLNKAEVRKLAHQVKEHSDQKYLIASEENQY